jgi:hypothetical protein
MLRIALPDEAEKETQSGKDGPTSTGWYRIWTRSELSFPAIPKYLGVWVQGPGTVWVDDLSLREVIPTPLDLAVDQDVYDGLDRRGILSVTVNRRPAPARIQFTLSRLGGGTVAHIVAPFEGKIGVAPETNNLGGVAMLLAPTVLNRCQFAFDPSRLAVGRWELRIELLDLLGEVVATRSKIVHRVSD